MAKTKSETPPADKDEIIRRQSEHIEQLGADLNELHRRLSEAQDPQLVAELEQLRTSNADLEDELERARAGAAQPTLPLGGLAIAAPFNPDQRIATVIGGRCEIQLRRLVDIQVINSLFEHLQHTGATCLDARETQVPVHRHSHAVLWLVQNVTLQDMPENLPKGGGM